MLRRNLIKILFFISVISILSSVLSIFLGKSALYMVTFPFEQIGNLLRMMSLSSGIGNIIAFALYIIFCLIPIIYFFKRLQSGVEKKEELLLWLISLLLFLVIYLMINPTYISYIFPIGMELGKISLCITIYTVIFTYFIFRLLRKFENMETEIMLTYLNSLLCGLCCILVVAIFYSELYELLNNFKSLLKGNEGYENELTISYVFLILGYVVNVLPFVLNIYIIFSGFKIIEELKVNPYSEEVGFLAGKTKDLCKKTIIIILSAKMIFNLTQLLFATHIRSSDFTMEIPIVSLILILIILIISRHFEELRKVKDDNDMII
ncbi:MAG: hypothetical protein ACK5LY_03435 [Lachnospirales bacterium]